MRISRTFVVSNFDEAIKNKIITYWGNRNAQFTKICENEFHATRGSLLGNLTSLKMYKLKTSIAITVSEHNKVTCVLNINTLFQHITNWNREYWDLELETFESFLLNDDLKEQEWDVLTKKSKRKDIVTTLSIVSLTGLLTFIFTTNLLENGTMIPQYKQIVGTESIEENKTFTSDDGSVQLIASEDWKTKDDLHEQAILQIANLSKNKYFVIIDESKADFASDTTISEYATLILDGMKQSTQNATVSEPLEVTINNNKGLQYIFKGEVDKLKVSYYVTIIETPETFYQVIGWSLQSNFDEYKEEFKTITSTFKTLAISLLTIS